MCGESNTVNHLLICKKGGYVSLCHNSLRDIIAELMKNAGCKDVHTEPQLLSTDGVQLPSGANIADDARVDVSARSVWNPLERALFDVRVFHAPAPSNRALKTIPAIHRNHEMQKKREYIQCSYTPNRKGNFYTHSVLNIWRYGKRSTHTSEEISRKDIEDKKPKIL